MVSKEFLGYPVLVFAICKFKCKSDFNMKIATEQQERMDELYDVDLWILPDLFNGGN